MFDLSTLLSPFDYKIFIFCKKKVYCFNGDRQESTHYLPSEILFWACVQRLYRG